MRRLGLTALLSSLVVAVLAAQANAPQSLMPRFDAAPCPFELNATVSGQVHCGYLTVLENMRMFQRMRDQTARAPGLWAKFDGGFAEAS